MSCEADGLTVDAGEPELQTGCLSGELPEGGSGGTTAEDEKEDDDDDDEEERKKGRNEEKKTTTTRQLGPGQEMDIHAEQMGVRGREWVNEWA